jgi:hypothetical protein
VHQHNSSDNSKNCLFYVMQVQAPHNIFGLDFFSVGGILLAKCSCVSLFIQYCHHHGDLVFYITWHTSPAALQSNLSWISNGQLSDLHFLYILWENWQLWNWVFFSNVSFILNLFTQCISPAFLPTPPMFWLGVTMNYRLPHPPSYGLDIHTMVSWAQSHSCCHGTWRYIQDHNAAL